MSELRVILICGLAALSPILIAQTTADQDFSKRIADASALYRQGKPSEAITEFEDLHRIDAKNSDVDAWLGFLYLRADKAALAIPLLHAAELQRPLDLEVQINLGNAYMANGNLDEALDKYRSIIKLSPRMFEPFYNSGTIYLKKKDYTKAIVQFETAERLKPTDPYVQNDLGVSFEGLHDLQNAAKAYKRAAELRPDNITFAHNAGLALSKLRSPDAVPYLEKSLGDGKDPAVALALGDAYSRAGRKADALKYYEGLREAEATNSTFWFNLGVLRAQNQDSVGAEQAYRRALELNPTDLDAMNNLGLILFGRGAYDESTTLFDKLAGLNPGSIITKLNLAASAARSGNLKLAVSSWKEVLHEQPKRIGVRLDLANALWDQGAVDEARNNYMFVLTIDKNNAGALNGMGLYHLNAGQLPEAEAAFRSAIDSDPKLIEGYNNLAVTLQRMKHVADAIKILEKAEKIAPTDDDIKRNLARMRGEE